MNLHQINLNLLVSLDALLTETHVGRAARKAGVSQSAMSHSLRQLRELFDDPLLVRSGRSMVPTPRAEALAPLLQDGLLSLDRALHAHEVPDPATFTQTFVLATFDGPLGVSLPRLFARMRREAPLATLSVVTPPRDLSAAMAQGQVHAALIPPVHPPSGVKSASFVNRYHSTDWCVVGRAGHPALQGELDLDTYCALPHVMFTLTGVGGSFVDAQLEALGRRRSVVLRLPYALALPLAVQDTDAIVTTQALVAGFFERHHALSRVAPPPELDLPHIDMLLAWHERFDADPAQRWFRSVLGELAEGRLY